MRMPMARGGRMFGFLIRRNLAACKRGGQGQGELLVRVEKLHSELYLSLIEGFFGKEVASYEDVGNCTVTHVTCELFSQSTAIPDKKCTGGNDRFAQGLVSSLSVAG